MAINPLAIGGGVVAAVAVVGGGLYAGGVFGGSNSVNQQGSGGTDVPQKAVLAIGDYLSSNTNFKNTSGNYANKWAKDYGLYLVDSSKNTKWWGESYAAFESARNAKPKAGKFKTVNSVDTLKTICDEAYKAEASKVSDTVQTTENDKFKTADIWKYCSPLGQKPTTIEGKQETTNYTNKIGGGTNKGKLVSVTDTDNNEFWKVRQEHFFTEAGKPDDTHLFFKGLYDGKKAAITPDLLKNKCKDAYEKDANNNPSAADKPTEEETLKYCSLEGK